MQTEEEHAYQYRNILPPVTPDTLTIDQAVLYMLGYRGDYIFQLPNGETLDFDSSQYTFDLQESADADHQNAVHRVEELERDTNTPQAILNDAKQKVIELERQLNEAQETPAKAEEYRQLLDRLVQLTRLNKSTHLSIDEDTSQRKSETHLYADSFYKWYDHYKQDPDLETSNAHRMPFDEEAFTQDMPGIDAETLYITLGLLTMQLVESGGDKYGKDGDPNVSAISENLAARAYNMWGGEQQRKASGRKPRTAPSMGKKSISNRIDLALAALKAAY